MDQTLANALANVTDKTVLLTWNNAHSSSCVQDTVTALKERIGGGHLSLEHIERLHLGIYSSLIVYCVR